jgi:CelD/BcsL family acetyltransferase involved in cellulose biosynthesis
MAIVQIEICRPGELSEFECALWADFQSTSLEFQHPFLSPDFARAFDAVSTRARVAVAYERGRIVGFFPFQLGRGGIASPLGGRMTNRQAFVHAAALEWSWREILDRSKLSVVVCPDLVAAQGRDVRSLTPGQSPIIDTTSGWDDYIKAARGRKSIKTILYKERKLRRHAREVDFRVGLAPRPWLHQMIVWKSRQYRRTGRPDPFAHPATRELLARLNTDEFTTVRPEFSALVVDGRLVAADFSLATSTVFSAWFCAFDTALAPYSPGAIRTLHTIQHACTTGVVQFDLSRGDESYKQRLKNGDLDVRTGYMHRPTGSAVAYQLTRAPRTKAADYVLNRPRLRGKVRTALMKVGAARVALRP